MLTVRVRISGLWRDFADRQSVQLSIRPEDLSDVLRDQDMGMSAMVDKAGKASAAV